MKLGFLLQRLPLLRSQNFLSTREPPSPPSVSPTSTSPDSVYIQEPIICDWRIQSDTESEGPLDPSLNFSKKSDEVGSFFFGMLGGLAGTALLSLTAAIGLVVISQKPTKAIKDIPAAQGFDVNALSSENLQRREGLRNFLENDPATSILDAFSEVSGKVADYVKPAVVLISNPGETKAIGSGFIYRSDGIILTNHHAIENSPFGMMKVTLLDNQDLIGQVIGVDPKTDIAVIKVDKDNLPSLEIETDETKPGTWVMAVGLQYPNLGWSIAPGILSAENRNEITVNGLLQTTAPINPGSSGSPLVNRKGKVVGLNAAILPGLNNLGFSVPAKTLQEVVPRLITKGMANYYDVPDPLFTR